ncbi:methyltransferase domain-containing protein [candidate division KSB1 bacterium]|nr:methyltransferase domain-containing protein [candidate division KSB1 bacterium]
MSPFNVRTIVEQNRKAYDFLAYEYTKQWAKKPDLQLADEFITMLNGNRILDVGCGPGHYSSYFIDKGFAVEAIDNSANMLRIAARRDPRIKTRKLDMIELDYGNSEFDGLWVCASLPHIPKENVDSVLKRFRQILKKNGCMLVNAIIGHLEHRIETSKEMGKNYGGPGRFFQWYPTTVIFKKNLEKAGFQIHSDLRRVITSEVISNALWPTNFWYNCFCIVGKD